MVFKKKQIHSFLSKGKVFKQFQEAKKSGLMLSPYLDRIQKANEYKPGPSKRARRY